MRIKPYTSIPEIKRQLEICRSQMLTSDYKPSIGQHYFELVRQLKTQAVQGTQPKMVKGRKVFLRHPQALSSTLEKVTGEHPDEGYRTWADIVSDLTTKNLEHLKVHLRLAPNSLGYLVTVLTPRAGGSHSRKAS